MMRRMKIKAAPNLKPSKKIKLATKIKGELPPKLSNSNEIFDSVSNHIISQSSNSDHNDDGISTVSSTSASLVKISSGITGNSSGIISEQNEDNSNSITHFNNISNNDVERTNSINIPIVISEEQENISSPSPISIEKESDNEYKSNQTTTCELPKKMETFNKTPNNIVEVSNNESKNNNSSCSEKELEMHEVDPKERTFLERRQQFKLKLGDLNGGNFERSKITLFDLVYWNPPQDPSAPGQKKREQKQRRASLPSSSLAEEELQVEEANLNKESFTDKQASNISNSEKIVPSPDNSTQEIETNKDISNDTEDSETSSSLLVPKVKIGPNGELIIDEKSLVVQTTAAKDRNKILSNTAVIEESKETSHYGKWSKRKKRAPEWTKKETARFYKALSTVGTDFSLMSTVFSWRSRAELKIKFKKEERINKHLVDIALNDCTQFDFTIFEESDYDPVADRKEAKEKEKLEIKRKKEEERKKRAEERLMEKNKKLEQKLTDKNRKKILREENRKFKKKKRLSTLPPVVNFYDDSNESTATSVVVEAQEVVCEVVLSNSTKSNTENCEGYVTEHNVEEINEDPDAFRVSAEDSLVTANSELEQTANETTEMETTPSHLNSGTETQSLLRVQETEEGSRFVDVETSRGVKRLPVPPSADNVLVIPAENPEDPSDQIFHVYAVAPIQDTPTSEPSQIQAPNNSHVSL